MAGSAEHAEMSGSLQAAGLRFGLVVSRFNSVITDRLLAGALDALSRAGAETRQIDVVRVPGAFEIPLTARRLAETARYDALICIGCILRGETPHFEFVATETARGIQLAQLDTGIPMIFCVLTCDTLEQAMERSGGKAGNRGFDAGLAAVEMARLLRQIQQASPSGRRRR
jgi:6,7-dimethyl-8-ribityllumazine synthase